MKKYFLKLAALILNATFSISLSAGVISGNIHYVDSYGPPTTNLEDWYFHLDKSGMVYFDILAYEYDTLNSTWIDLNNDGSSDFLDSTIWLFKTDGELDSGDLIARNDDVVLGADKNGSLADVQHPSTTLDAYLSLFLAAGDYTLLIGSCCGNDLDFSTLSQRFEFSSPGASPKSGDYQLEFSDNLKLVKVSEPSSSWFMLFAIAGFLAFSRWRKGPGFL